jgi:hypothetical protein
MGLWAAIFLARRARAPGRGKTVNRLDFDFNPIANAWSSGRDPPTGGGDAR